MKVTVDGKIWEVRKPKGREIFMLEKIDANNLGGEASYNQMKKLLQKLIVKAPSDNGTTDQIDLDDLDADVFMELFYTSCKSVLDVAKKFQN